MAAISVNDGGTWRTPYQVSVNDGGTWRTIQQVYVNDGGTWRTVFQYLLLDATMSEGSYFDGVYDYIGYWAGNMGWMSSTSLPGGITVSVIFDQVGSSSTLALSGFGADPGQSYFGTITVGGVSKTSASASYAYGAGVASWTWASSYFGLDGSGTSAVAITP